MSITDFIMIALAVALGNAAIHVDWLKLIRRLGKRIGELMPGDDDDVV